MGNILIIGGTKGIGKRIVELLPEENKFVVARNSIADFDSTTKIINCDITKDSIDINLLPEVIDGFVYCPGSVNLKPFQRITDSDFLEDFQINVLGAVKILQAILPNLKKSTSPAVVFFSTIAVKKGLPYHASIAASKGAIEGLTVTLAAEWAPKIRVNCIAPSLVNTSLTEKLLNTPEKIKANELRNPLRKIGAPDDIAQLAVFLLSEKAGWISGQIMHVDGGMSSISVG